MSNSLVKRPNNQMCDRVIGTLVIASVGYLTIHIAQQTSHISHFKLASTPCPSWAQLPEEKAGPTLPDMSELDDFHCSDCPRHPAQSRRPDLGSSSLRYRFFPALPRR